MQGHFLMEWDYKKFEIWDNINMMQIWMNTHEFVLGTNIVNKRVEIEYDTGWNDFLKQAEIDDLVVEANQKIERSEKVIRSSSPKDKGKGKFAQKGKQQGNDSTQ